MQCHFCNQLIIAVQLKLSSVVIGAVPLMRLRDERLERKVYTGTNSSFKMSKKKILKIPEEMKRSRETGKGRKQHEKQKER